MVSGEKRYAAGLMITTGILSGVEGAHFFSARLPSKFTTRKFASTPEDRANLESAIWESAAMSLGMGVGISVISYLAKIPFAWIPGVTNAAMTAAMTYMYVNDLNAGQLQGMNRNGAVL